MMEEIIKYLQGKVSIKRLGNHILLTPNEAQKIIDFYNQHQWTAGVELIAKERKEQIEKHGRTIEGDYVNNRNGELVAGAIALSMEIPNWHLFPITWDKKIIGKMIAKPYKDRVIIAATLLTAEVDRLLYGEGQ